MLEVNTRVIISIHGHWAMYKSPAHSPKPCGLDGRQQHLFSSRFSMCSASWHNNIISSDMICSLKKSTKKELCSVFVSVTCFLVKSSCFLLFWRNLTVEKNLKKSANKEANSSVLFCQRCLFAGQVPPQCGCPRISSGTHPCNVDTRPFPQIHFFHKFTLLDAHKNIRDGSMWWKHKVAPGNRLNRRFSNFKCWKT